MDTVWTVKAALDWTEGFLGRKGDENPRLSAQWLLSEATGLSRIELYTALERPLSMPERDVLRDIVARRGAGEPLQYITGEVGFRHITIKVDQGVLIPRPETEVLVSEALAALPSISLYEEPEEVLVADLCTGSGCIACSIAHEYPAAHVVATDLASQAIVLAQRNIDALCLSDRIDLYECDLAEGILLSHLGHFDLVVSNPPYIPTGVMDDIPSEVSEYEPSLALNGGEDGLDVFRRIVTWARQALRVGGVLVVELHETCLDAASEIAGAQGFGATRVVDDLAGRPRILVATWPGEA